MSRLISVIPPAPQTDDINELKRYINNSLQIISSGLQALSQVGGANIVLENPPSTPVAVGTTAQVVSEFDRIVFQDDIIVDLVNAKFTTTFAGRGRFNLDISVQADSNNRTLTYFLTVDGVQIPSTKGQVFLKTANEPAYLSLNGLINIPKGSELQLYVQSDTATNLIYQRLSASLELGVV